MKLSERITNAVLRTLLRMFFTMNLDELEKVPRTGPFMLIANHTSTFDGPLMYVFMRPREMVAMAKQELWDHMGTRFLMNLWNSIDRKSVV